MPLYFSGGLQELHQKQGKRIYIFAQLCYYRNIYGDVLDSTYKAESVWQAEAPNFVKMGKAINAKNNQPALAYAA
jgi:hypothetical protein